MRLAGLDPGIEFIGSDLRLVHVAHHVHHAGTGHVANGGVTRFRHQFGDLLQWHQSTPEIGQLEIQQLMQLVAAVVGIMDGHVHFLGADPRGAHPQAVDGGTHVTGHRGQIDAHVGGQLAVQHHPQFVLPPLQTALHRRDAVDAADQGDEPVGHPFVDPVVVGTDLHLQRPPRRRAVLDLVEGHDQIREVFRYRVRDDPHVVDYVVFRPGNGRNVGDADLAEAAAALGQGIAAILGDLAAGEQRGLEVFRIDVFADGHVHLAQVIAHLFQTGARRCGNAHHKLIDARGRKQHEGHGSGQQNCTHQYRHGDQQRKPAPVHGDGQHPGIDVLQPLQPAPLAHLVFGIGELPHVIGQDQEGFQPGEDQQGDHHHRNGNDELADEAGHEHQRHEGDDGGHHRGRDRTDQFGGPAHRGLVGFHPLLHVPGDVLADDDGIVHQHPEHHDESEHGDQVDGDPGGIEHEQSRGKDDGQSPGSGEGHRGPQEQQQREEHQHQPHQAVVGQHAQAQTGVGGEVLEGGVGNVLAVALLQFPQIGMDAIHGLDDIGVGLLHDDEVERRCTHHLVVETGLLQILGHVGHVVEGDTLAPFVGPQNQGAHVAGLLELADDTHRLLPFRRHQLATGRVEVPAGEQFLDVGHRDAVFLQLGRIDDDPDLGPPITLDLDASDTGNGQQIVLDPVPQPLQFQGAAGRRNRHVDHRDHLAVDFQHRWFAGQIARQAGPIHGQLHVAHDPGAVAGVRIQFEDDAARAGKGDGGHLVDAVHRFQFLFDGRDDQPFHFLRCGAGIGGVDLYLVEVDVGKGLAIDLHARPQAKAEQEEGDEIDHQAAFGEETDHGATSASGL